MGRKSKIEWTDATWNPVTGCNKVSPGCMHCYAETLAERFRGTPGHPYEQGFDLKLWPERLTKPLEWKRPSMIFVNSMSDLFHKDVPLEFIQRVFDTMNNAHWHTFQVLTKRAERLAEVSGLITWTSNIWAGVSVESQPYLHRIDHLLKTGAQTRFLSLEPLLGPLPNLHEYICQGGIHWVIVGGESGRDARPCDPAWVRQIRNQCIAAHVPFFFKQWGGENKKATGRLLDGETWDQMPKPTQRSLFD